VEVKDYYAAIEEIERRKALGEDEAGFIFEQQ
jgi:hypothetical protein